MPLDKKLNYLASYQIPKTSLIKHLRRIHHDFHIQVRISSFFFYREAKTHAANNERDCRFLCANALDSAKEKMRSQNYRLAYYDLTNIFKNTKHRLDIHKQIETEALCLVISALGQNENPGCIYFLLNV